MLFVKGISNQMDVAMEVFVVTVLLTGIFIHCYCSNSVETGEFTDCGDQVAKISNRCYWFSTEKRVSWKYARNLCQATHGDLGQPKQQRENEKIKKYLKRIDQQCTRCYWIGLHKENDFFTSLEGAKYTFTFLDGTELAYSDWAPGEPNGGTATQFRCASGVYHWYDERWPKKCAFICQLNECPDTCHPISKANSPTLPVHGNKHVADVWTTSSSNIGGDNTRSQITQSVALATSPTPYFTTTFADLSDNKVNVSETTPLWTTTAPTGTSEVKDETEDNKYTRSTGSLTTPFMSTMTFLIIISLQIMSVITI